MRRNQNFLHELASLRKFPLNFEIIEKFIMEENCKPNINNPFYLILVNIPKILHAENEEDPVENKKMVLSDVLAKLGERKNGQVQATLKTRSCMLFSCICALKDIQNSLISKSEKFLELTSKLRKK
jgi:hypothetical protein